MFRKASTLATLVVLALPFTARAQAGFGVAAGYSAPNGDFGKVVEGGYHITGLVKVSAPLMPIGARFEGTFSEFKYKNSPPSTSDAKARILSATANATYSMSGILGPYLIAGVGIYRATAECDQCTTSSTKGGYNAGLGFKWGLSGFSAFVEARIHYIPGPSDPTNGGTNSSTRFIPVTFGLVF